jgi:hypothetical protein
MRRGLRRVAVVVATAAMLLTMLLTLAGPAHAMARSCYDSYGWEYADGDFTMEAAYPSGVYMYVCQDGTWVFENWYPD